MLATQTREHLILITQLMGDGQKLKNFAHKLCGTFGVTFAVKSFSKNEVFH